MTIGVFVVDDHPLFRAGVRLATEDIEDLEVVGEAESAEEAVRALVHERVRADVVLMDVQMPDASGISVVAAITAAQHLGTEGPRVLMMSMSDDDDMVVAALPTVARKGAVFSPAVAARMGSYFSVVHELARDGGLGS
ncbi:response regulator [Streptomyces sp. SLBN-8D4]|uniref:response regulator n=1 Tax=Streptomyces sp. SLBN-8D4 TaxID=3377728 RepID=UPI003C7DE8AD